MPIQAQPPGREGTHGRPYSALNLRLGLALFGVVFCGVVGFLMLRAGLTVPGWLLIALGVVAAVDAVVVQLRRRARARAGERGHSIFE
jgi:uncharacterized membrane protein